MKFDAYRLKKDAEFDSFFDTLTVEERKNICGGVMWLWNELCLHPEKSAEWQKKWDFYEGIKWLCMSRNWRDQAERNRQYYAQRFDTIVLVLWHEGKQMDLNNNFGVYFITQKGKKSKCIQAQTVANSFIVPNLGTDTSGIIMFEYQHQYYTVYDGRNFVSEGRTYYRNLYNIKSAEKIKMVFDIQPYNYIEGRTDGKWNECEEEDKHSYLRHVNQIKNYENAIGYYAVYGCRWITYSFKPVFSTKDFFKENKKMKMKATKSQ
jgi:hypothetical protein